MQPNSTRVSLSDAIVEKLEEMIATMKPGDRLPTEMELADQFSVGRSTIRESMKVLTAKKWWCAVMRAPSSPMPSTAVWWTR